MKFTRIAIVGLLVAGFSTSVYSGSTELKLYEARYTKEGIDNVLETAATEFKAAGTAPLFSTYFSLATDSKLNAKQLKSLFSRYEAAIAEQSDTANIVAMEVAAAKAYQQIPDPNSAAALYKLAALYVTSLEPSLNKDRFLADIVTGTCTLPKGRFDTDLWRSIQDPLIKINVLAQVNPTPALIAECPSTNIKKEYTTIRALAWAKANSGEKALLAIGTLPTVIEQLWALSLIIGNDEIPSASKQAIETEISRRAGDSTDKKNQLVAQSILVPILMQTQRSSTADQYLQSIQSGITEPIALEDKIKIALTIAPSCIKSNRADIILSLYAELFKYETSDPILVKAGIRQLNSKLVAHYLAQNARKNARKIDTEFQSIGLDRTANVALFWDAVAEKNQEKAIEYAKREPDAQLLNRRYVDLTASFGDNKLFKQLVSDSSQ